MCHAAMDWGGTAATAATTDGKPCTNRLPANGPVQPLRLTAEGMRKGLCRLISAFPATLGLACHFGDLPDAAPRRKDPDWEECPQTAGEWQPKVSRDGGLTPNGGNRRRGAAQYGGLSQPGGRATCGARERVTEPGHAQSLLRTRQPSLLARQGSTETAHPAWIPTHRGTWKPQRTNQTRP